MTEKTLTTENIKPALDALRGELAPWPVMAMKQDKLNDTQKSAVNSGITSGLVAQIIANTAAIRALESAITGTGLRPLVVASLPAIGTQGILYIVPVTTYDPATDADVDADVVNYSDEYIWIVAPDAPVTQGYYEQVGRTGIVINNGQLTITVNGTSVGTFTANQSGDTTAAITVPTNADYVDKTTAQTAAGVKTFSDGIVGNVTGNVTGDLTGTASRTVADADGNTISSTYGKLAGSQTWSGLNTYSIGQIKIQSQVQQVGVTPQTSTIQYLEFVDKNNVQHGLVGLWDYDNGASEIQLNIRDTFSNGSKDPNGTSDTAFFSFGFQPTGVKFVTFSGQLNNSVIPLTSNTYTLGTSTNQWSSVYAQSYYYNGTQWGLDKANEWTGSNAFTSPLLHKTPQSIDIVNDLAESITGTGLAFWDNNRYWASFDPQWLTNGAFRLSLGISNYSTSGGQGWWPATLWEITKDFGTLNVFTTHGNANLGTSTNKWKTLNGVNPGALSLPDLSSRHTISISGDLTDLTGGDNFYRPPCDGWLTVVIAGTKLALFEDASSSNPATQGCGISAAPDPNGYCSATLPVHNNVRVKINAVGTSVYMAQVRPSLGNV